MALALFQEWVLIWEMFCFDPTTLIMNLFSEAAFPWKSSFQERQRFYKYNIYEEHSLES